MNLAAIAVVLLVTGCASDPRSRTGPDDYLLRRFELPFNENVRLHWSRRQMPLRVHLPVPPDGLYADPLLIYAAVLHEMGHALGLAAHSPDRADVMGRSLNVERRPEVTARDRATLRALYAKPNGHRVTGPKRAE
jgi:hypothetical protein